MLKSSGNLNLVRSNLITNEVLVYMEVINKCSLALYVQIINGRWHNKMQKNLVNVGVEIGTWRSESFTNQQF